MSNVVNLLNALLRTLVEKLSNARVSGADYNELMRIVDEVENNFDMLVAQSAPERITDERFSSAVEMLKDVAEKLRNLRESILDGKFTEARRIALDIQESIRHAYRILMLLKAGAPVPIVYQVAPQFLREITPPEQVVYMSPLASQIYNILVRRREASLDQIALELRIDEKTRDEFNRAVAQLVASGYVQISLTPDNRVVLRLVRW